MPFERTYPDDADPEVNAQRATAALVSTQFGPVKWVAETGSTNEDLMAQAVAGAPHGCVLVADHQTSGRGRRARRWVSVPRTALQVSLLLRPDIDPSAVGLLTAALGVAAAEACEGLGSRGVRIKWPNDLVVGEVGERRKLAGMLAQVKVVGTDVAVVAGLGLNVRTTDADPRPGTSADMEESGVGDKGEAPGPRPALFPDTAAWLQELGPVPSRVDLLIAVLSRLDDILTDLDAGPESLWASYRTLSATLGTRVRAELDGEVIEGDALDISDRGALIVDVGSGLTREIVVADVVSVRPGGATRG